MDQAEKKLGYWPVAAIGIGGMVGGGIFAVLGLSVQMTHGAAPLAFLAAGFVALTTAYAYTRLSVTFPGQGGTVVFLDQAFGPGFFTGTANVLLWISYIVMLSLYAYAFGSYAAAMFPEGSRSFWWHVLTSAATLLVSNFFDLSSISTVGSAGFLLIFAIVNAANVRLASKTGSRCWISMVAMLLCLGALYSLIRYTWQHAPSHIWALVAMLLLAFAVEGAYRLWRRGSLLLEYLH